ncbi:hypothetical protein D3C81_1798780 [compost metagenome]
MPFSKTKVGAIELRGRLPGCTRFAIKPFASLGSKEKSVNSLFNKKPSTIWREPKPFSIVVVIATARPLPSTMEICEVDGNSGEVVVPQARRVLKGSPGCALPMEVSLINAARRARYFLSSIGKALPPGSGTKSGSAI